MSKPDLSLYLGQKVIAITHGENGWDWGIKLESGVEIRNKNKLDTFRPMQLVNYRLRSLSLSMRDTTLHFVGEGAAKVTVSFAPTKYVVADPKHGGEVYPQWPELLEEMGIPAIEGGEISDKPSEDWPVEEKRLVNEQDRKREREAMEFLEGGDKQ